MNLPCPSEELIKKNDTRLCSEERFDYFVMNGTTQENEKASTQNPICLMV